MKPWSYADDLTVVENSHLTAKEIYDLLSGNHSIQLVNRRRLQLKNKTEYDLILEEIYITNNHDSMTEKEMAEYLDTTQHYIKLRLMSLQDEGKIEGEKPKLTQPVYEVKPFTVQPMKKEMVVEYNAAPKGSLSKVAIQEDILKVDNLYLITTKHKSEKNGTKLIKERFKLVGCYLEHYLFVNDKGLKQSLTKRDFYLKEWQYEEVI